MDASVPDPPAEAATVTTASLGARLPTGHRYEYPTCPATASD